MCKRMLDIKLNFYIYVFYSIGLELHNSYLKSLQLIGMNWLQKTLSYVMEPIIMDGPKNFRKREKENIR